MLNLQLVDRVQEVIEGLITASSVRDAVRHRKVIVLKSGSEPICVGHGMLVKVNTNIGLSAADGLDSELEKLDALSEIGYSPDTLMDHSFVHIPGREFFERMVERFSGPVGVLPHYLAFNPVTGIDRSELLEITRAQAEAGVSFMTLHPTPSRALYEKAKASRAVPTTSRGGGIVLKDLYLRNRSENIIAELFPDLLDILSQHGMALSIGSTFRPGSVSEALDEVHLEETKVQGHFLRLARDAGVPVQIEGIGHITLDQIPEYFRLLSKWDAPMMPLGPLPTDAGIGEDHIVNAVGAAFAGYLGGAHIINSITCEEHTGGVPTCESVLGGLKAARIAAHIVNIARFKSPAELDARVATDRAKHTSCVVAGGLFSRSAAIRRSLGCTRCGDRCPLVIAESVDRESSENANGFE